MFVHSFTLTFPQYFVGWCCKRYGPLPILSSVEKIYDGEISASGGGGGGGSSAITFTREERERSATVWAKEHGVAASSTKVMTLKKGGLSASKGKR